MTAQLVLLLDDATPEDADVVAGPLGFLLWIFLIAAVVILGRSLVVQLRKAQAAKDAGVYGDEPVRAEPSDEASADTPADTPSAPEER